MKQARNVFYAALAVLAILAEAHHEVSPEREVHTTAVFRTPGSQAGPTEFVSIFLGGSFRIPSALQ